MDIFLKYNSFLNKKFLFVLGILSCYLAFPNIHCHVGWLIIVVFIPLFKLMEDRLYFWSRFRLCWLFFQVFFLCLFWMNPFKYYERYESIDMIAILVVFYGVFPICFALIFSLFNAIRPWKTCCVLPLVWGLFECSMAFFSFGFPFSLAIALYRYPVVIGSVHYIGIMGLSSLILVINSAFYFGIISNLSNHIRRYFIILGIVIIFILGCLGAFFRLDINGVNNLKLRQSLICVQPNIPWRMAYYSYQDNFYFRQILNRLTDYTAQIALREQQGVFIFPELTLSDFNSSNKRIEQLFRQVTATQFGLVIGARDGQYNTILGVNTQGDIVSRYYKQQLIPVFERDEPATERENLPVVTADKSDLFGLSLCYELLFPNISKQLVNQGAQLVGAISFNSWLGNNNWPLLHAAYLPFRAVENKRPGIFVNNNGPSLACDRFGRITHWIDIGKRGYFVIEH